MDSHRNGPSRPALHRSETGGVSGDPHPPAEAGDFPARAERERRCGDPAAALELAREGLRGEAGHWAGRVAAALALLDLGRVEDARAELESLIALEVEEESAPLADLLDEELEQAFADTLAGDDEISAPPLVELEPREDARERSEGYPAVELPSETFQTREMAELLAQQGDHAGAAAIRVALDEAEAPASLAPEDPRLEILERWLRNLKTRAA